MLGPTTNLTVRLPLDIKEQLESVAHAMEHSQSSIARDAIQWYLTDVVGQEQLGKMAHDRQWTDESDISVQRTQEMTFFDRRRDLAHQLAGQWAAIDGDTLISHGRDFGEVLRDAKEKGYPHPFITDVPDPDLSVIM